MRKTCPWKMADMQRECLEEQELLVPDVKQYISVITGTRQNQYMVLGDMI